VNFLDDLPFDGYPTGYLLARLRGASPPDPAAPVGDGSGETLWWHSQHTMDWLYRQMNPSLRRPMACVFILLELRTLVLCLRNKVSRPPDTVENLLAFSLWATGLKRILLADEDLPAGVAAVSTWLARRQENFTGLPAAYGKDGLRGFEGALYQRYLQHVLAGGHPVAIRRVLTHYVDLRNLLGLYKKLRWQLTGPGAYLAGGSLSPATLKQIEPAGRPQAMEPLLASFASGTRISPEGIETALMVKLSRDLHRSRLVGDPIGAILDFLFGHFIRARNSRLRHLCSDLDRDTLDSELVA
jgi:hypothetical protein